MTYQENEQAEETKQQKRIEDFRRLTLSVITCFAIGSVSVIQGKKRLNNSRDPEKANQPGNE
jgi:hypothetical protein